MKTHLFKLLFSIAMIYFFINDCNAEVYVANPSNNSTVTRGLCKYYVDGSNANHWIIDTIACVKTFSNGTIDPAGFKSHSEVLYVKWKNIERNASTQIIAATYGLLNKPTEFTEVGPFTLDMPTPTFSLGSTYNINCYVNTPVTISLNPYINTADNGIDKGLEITSQFEWTLPSGWRTTEGQIGTFDSSSSISVIPPASTSPVSISVRAKANTQYSSVATLQITRNLNFTINGPNYLLCNTTQRYSVPQVSGATYSWQNQSGWLGQSTTNYIDVTAQNTSTCTLFCTVSTCGQSKMVQKTITAIQVDPATSISGPSTICGSDELYSITNLAPMNFIGWTCSTNLQITSGNVQSPNCTVKRIGAGSGWIKLQLVSKCGGTFYSQKTVGEPELTTNFSGASYIPLESSGSWTASASGCAPFHYEWWLREASSSPADAIQIGEGSTLTLVSYPRYSLAASKTQSLSVQSMLQPPSNTTYFLKLQVFDAYGNTYTTTEKQILAEGNVDLINLSQGAIMQSSVEEKASTIELNISPNPAKDETTLEINSNEAQVLDGSIEWQVEIYDAMQSLKTKLPKIKGSIQAIQTSGWKDGIYIVRAKVGNELLTGKLVIKK